MGPELLLRTAPPSRASDVYAWAVLVNEMATGAWAEGRRDWRRYAIHRTLAGRLTAGRPSAAYRLRAVRSTSMQIGPM